MLFNGSAAIPLAGALVVWLAALSFWVYKTSAHYSKLIRATGKLELKAALEKLLDEQEKVNLHLKELEGLVAELEKKGEGHFQKMGVVRFNPFSETGGDQSFALSLLDQKDSGVVILSLHNREGTRIYAKTVKTGKSRYELSKEETKAIEEARKNK